MLEPSPSLITCTGQATVICHCSLFLLTELLLGTSKLSAVGLDSREGKMESEQKPFLRGLL